jgi:hypothetical protein
MRRLIMLFLAALLCGATLSPLPTSVAAQGDRRCFAETGHCISGPIRAYWERNGGLTVFGYPITAQRQETVEGRTIQVQWFERDRLEIQADGSLTAGRLGARYLELTGRPWQQFPKDQPLLSPECRHFSTTGFNVCGWFAGHWERNGGLERFGYPISPVIEERIEGKTYVVQYFERRRMESHPENSYPYNVLLGLLGREVLVREGATGEPLACVRQLSPAMRAFYPRVQLGRPLGCPVAVANVELPAAVQTMERGEMLWYGRGAGRPLPGDESWIYAVVTAGGQFSFRSYPDRWIADQDPDTPAVTPPRPGLYAPWRGFGKAWSEDPELQGQIGWAVEPQARPERVYVQPFDSGIVIVFFPGRGMAYAFGDTSNLGEVQRLD